MEKLPNKKQELEIGGKTYTFEFTRRAVVSLLEKDIDFDEIKIDIDNGVHRFLKAMPDLVEAALQKNHKDITTSTATDIADELCDTYAVDEIMFMFVGLYSAVFTVGGKTIPLAQETRTMLTKAQAEVDKLKKDLEKKKDKA